MKNKTTTKHFIGGLQEDRDFCRDLFWDGNLDLEKDPHYYLARTSIYRQAAKDNGLDGNGRDKKRFNRKADSSFKMYNELIGKMDLPF